MRFESRLARARLRRAVAAFSGLTALACSEDFTLSQVGGGRSPPVVPRGSDASIDDAGCSSQLPPEGALPCAVAAVLEARCQRCHSEPEVTEVCETAGECVAGPFPLKTLADVHAEYFEEPIWQRMQNAVESGFMPLQGVPLDPPVEPLTEEERAVLLDWLGACAPAGSDACGPG